MVDCVAGDAGAMIIVDRVTMEGDLQLFGDDPRKVLMTSQSKVFMTRTFFARWADAVFFLTIESRRAETG
jgi:hypothetical protein